VREAGRDTLPVTFVARDAAEEVLGAVGLDTYDLDERGETSPWVTGMIVCPDRRGEGVGRSLMQHLERWAAEHGIAEAWVGTDLAAGFYQRCGWTVQETFTSSSGEPTTVLSKSCLQFRGPTAPASAGPASSDESLARAGGGRCPA
jgi:GNAT superfamily N-acetyltransferase